MNRVSYPDSTNARREGVEQLRVARLVLVVEIVDRIDQSDAEHEAPEPVHGRAGEERVVRGRQPPGERDPRAFLELPLGFLVVQECGRDGAIPPGDREFAPIEYLSEPAALLLDSGVERGQTPELVASPPRERVIVALGAFQLHAHEEPRGGRGEILRFALFGCVEG